MGDREDFLMNRALALAEQAAGMGEVPVGCVVVRGDDIIGKGYNRRETDHRALAHAEILAIDEACAAVKSWRLCGCELFVTLEPCPMCAGAIINARIDKVFFGARDTKAGALVSRIDLFELGFNHRPKIHGGLLSDRSAQMLSEFFAARRQDKQP